MGENFYLDTQRGQKSGSQDCFKAHIGLVYIWVTDICFDIPFWKCFC